MTLRILVLSSLLLSIIIACSRPSADVINNKTANATTEVAQVATTRSVHNRTPEANYKEFCASCHGAEMDAFVDRKWQYGNSDEDLFKAIKVGYEDDGMPAYEVTFSDEEISDLVAYIQDGIKNVDRYKYDDVKGTGVFQTEELSISLDTIASGMEHPWGLAFLPSGDILITDRDGELFNKKKDGELVKIKGVPAVNTNGQGGLLDIELHPKYEENGWIYISYSKPNPDDEKECTTAIVRAKLTGNTLVDHEEIFVALPYSSRRHHFGHRFQFDREGYLYFSVGDRGNRDVNPQNLDNHCGKIHRINDDGSIPADNPFVNTPGAMKSIYTYGNRNPQGVAMNPLDGSIWQNEHGPRGGDEINIVQKGVNYGWPVISYGINYNGTPFTGLTEKEGMEQPVMYWLPSIGVCGMTFVNSDKYGNWENNVLSGSLRFKYLERGVIKDNKVVHRENILENIGRLRVVEMSPDGYIYVGVEEPGYVFRLVPGQKSAAK